MKKFLSLVLALVMTMSLVTIGAGATEYTNLTDKSEIQYEEAVAVLNKLGIVTGYEDGSFKPTGALTRGAAAKIIVSLMIGSESASNLTVAAAPYKDVPVTNTFAAVISYCKTAGYINGYADGTFRPTAALTGYAFAKMLLGAAGYRGDVEGFTGSGWTMNVAKLGNQAGLFDDFAPAFSGNAGVDRQSACLLALNTLKATEVEYTANGNNLNVNDKGNIVGATTNYTRSYVTSRNDNINQNISKEKSGNDSSYYTLEFGEEHFPDLKLTADGTASDDFGRPSNQWTFKNVKIGTYALTPDYTYTTEADGDTDVDEVKDMGLKDFYFDKNTTLTENGVNKSETLTVGKTTLAANAKILAGLGQNGTLVEVYLDDDNADTIQAVVVVKSQLMQVNAVKSNEVTLKNIEDDGFLTKTVKSVKDDDDAFQTLKGLKADDYVLVVPLKDGSSYKVDSVSVPQTVTGKMTNIATKSGNTKVKAITVAGTAYKMSELWSSEDGKLSTSTKLSTSKDATVYLDKYGYAIYVKDVTDSNSAIIVDEIYSSLVDGKIVKYVKGWDSKGNELSLNLGNSPVYPKDRSGVRYDETSIQGKVFEYQTSTSNSADYKLVDAISSQGTSLSGTNMVYTVTNELQSIVAGQYAGYITSNTAYVSPVVAKDTKTGKTLPFASDVKFIFESIDSDDGDVTGITVNEGVTEVKKDIGIAGISYILNDKCDKIVAVVIPNDDDSANTANLLYVQKVTGYKNNTEGKRVALFTAYIDGEKVTDCEYTKESLTGNAFYTYSKNETTGVYSLTEYKKTDKITSVYYDAVLNVAKTAYVGESLTSANFAFGNDYFGTKLAGTKLTATSGYYVLNAKSAKVIDLYTDDGVDYSSVKDMKDAIGTKDVQGAITGFNVTYIFNGSDNTNAGKVDYVFVTSTNHTAAPVVTGNYSSVVDSSLTGAASLDMSAYSIDSSYAITMNVAAGQNLQTQVKEFLAYKGYTNIGNMSWNGTVYEITATNPDGIVVVLKLNAPDNTNTYDLVTVGSTKKYVVASTTVNGLGINGNDGKSYVKIIAADNTVSYKLNNANAAGDVVVNGSTYATDAFVNVTMDTVTGIPALNGNTVTATVPANTFVKVGEKVTVTLGVTPADPAANVTASINGQITASGATAASALDSATEIIANSTAAIVTGMTSVEVTLTVNTGATVTLTLSLT